MPQVNITFNVFVRLMKTATPQVHQLFEQCGIQPSMFLVEWVLCIFSNIFSVEMCARVWD
jgi:hypothetical protein